MNDSVTFDLMTFDFRAYPDSPISKRPNTEIPPPAVSRLSAPFGKRGREGAAEWGICSTRQSYESENYSDRRLDSLTKPICVTLNVVKGLAFPEIRRLWLRMTVVLLEAVDKSPLAPLFPRGDFRHAPFAKGGRATRGGIFVASWLRTRVFQQPLRRS
jgi:hypothetical protein